MFLKIIGGEYKGFCLNTVKSIKTRHTSHLVRKAIFDTIGNKIINSFVLDLFSGSGAYGFEALSRKAKQVYSVDNLFLAIQTIKKNKKKINLNDDKIKIFYSDVLQIIKKIIKQKLIFDLIILDPPYFYKNYIFLFNYFGNITNSNSTVVYEIHHKSFLPNIINNFILTKSKKYGTKKVYYYQKNI
ncbi:16S rRNA (guanine(966)-N(2))-methyltransferase RsmD [Candidatus Phytoplasma pini]|uniref:N6-adenine-specific methylase n=1 Tax=Candidatus Phytoplasma pini TaxID=267362 RepID=A0A559KJ96_9MOLU|nr:16S rRNA (guanine(966)-N(2))-methyltransferase RsmD [Candidatus Phytoplasma pini]TVY12201.1 N6-adenine-specific methylase [Candidatus Phytoplasma pini]